MKISLKQHKNKEKLKTKKLLSAEDTRPLPERDDYVALSEI